jgi:hypothetical protein
MGKRGQKGVPIKSAEVFALPKMGGSAAQFAWNEMHLSGDYEAL